MIERSGERRIERLNHRKMRVFNHSMIQSLNHSILFPYGSSRRREVPNALRLSPEKSIAKEMRWLPDKVG